MWRTFLASPSTVIVGLGNRPTLVKVHIVCHPHRGVGVGGDWQAAAQREEMLALNNGFDAVGFEQTFHQIRFSRVVSGVDTLHGG